MKQTSKPSNQTRVEYAVKYEDLYYKTQNKQNVIYDGLTLKIFYNIHVL